jgi:hypothetical protein
MAILFHVKEGEPPESIVQEKEMLLEDIFSSYSRLKYEYYGKYFPVIEDDNQSGENKIVLKVLETDEKVFPYDKIGYYLLVE